MSIIAPQRPILPLALPPSGLAHKPVSDDGRFEIGLGLGGAGAFFVLFLGWAALTPLDAATQAQGDVIVSGHRQSVQNREGGIISAIHVQDGQSVKAGDVLFELNGGEIRAQERALSGQYLGLQAQKARLLAEQSGQRVISWPTALLSPAPDDRDAAVKAMAVQQAQFETRRVVTETQKSVLRKKASEFSQQIEGVQRQIEASETQRKLLEDELRGVQSLAAEGYAPQSRVRSLQRDQAALMGQRGQFTAEVAQANDQSAEARLQIVQVDKQRAEEIATQLRDVQFQLGDIEPKLAAARDLAARQKIRAPTDGVVMGLRVTTIGGVIAPGERLLDVVPAKADLVVEARVAPKDADDIRVGDSVEVKFPSIHDRRLRTLKARLTKLSADALTDEKTGAPYFQLEATLSPEAVRSLEKADRGQFDLKPGLPAQLSITLRKRTVLQYLIDPISDSLGRSFRER